MVRRFFAAFAVLSVMTLPSCLSNDDPSEFTFERNQEGECIPGFQVSCGCPGDGPNGVQVCTENRVFGECDCSSSSGGTGGGTGGTTGGSCTLFPDCGGCIDCFESCVCFTGGADIEGCGQQCISGGSGGTGGGVCIPEECEPSGFGLGTPCCADGQCGLDLFLGCIPRDAPGDPDPNCPLPQNFPMLPGIDQGCCTPEGVCGILTPPEIGLGCVDPRPFEQFLGPPVPCF